MIMVTMPLELMRARIFRVTPELRLDTVLVNSELPPEVTPQEYGQILGLLRQLDIPPRQSRYLAVLLRRALNQNRVVERVGNHVWHALIATPRGGRAGAQIFTSLSDPTTRGGAADAAHHRRRDRHLRIPPHALAITAITLAIAAHAAAITLAIAAHAAITAAHAAITAAHAAISAAHAAISAAHAAAHAAAIHAHVVLVRHRAQHHHGERIAAIERHDRNGHRVRARVLQPIDVAVDGAGGSLHRDIQFRDPALHLGENPRIRRHRDDRVDAVHRDEFDGTGRLVGKRVGLEDLIQLFLQIAGTAVLHFEQAHALSGELIAVE